MNTIVEVSDIAKALGCSGRRVRETIVTGEFPWFKIGKQNKGEGRWAVSSDDFKQFYPELSKIVIEYLKKKKTKKKTVVTDSNIS